MSKIPLPLSFADGVPVSVSKTTEYFDPSHYGSSFPFGVYFTTTYGVMPSVVHINKTYTEDLIHFLRKNGALFCEQYTVPDTAPKKMTLNSYIDDFSDAEPEYRGTILYKDCVVSFQRAASRKTKRDVTAPNLFTVSVFFKPGKMPPVNDFDEFLYEESLNSVIHTIFRDEQGSIVFEPFETDLPKSYDVELYNNEGFVPIHNSIVNSLKKNESGLYLFHGEPGTGKTTYIKYLADILSRDMIYVPVAFIDSLIDPAFLPALLKKRHSVLVIEDAEKALLAREGGESSSLVSAILNITDGIMGNMFNISVIATYNSKRQDIDKALLRKGRLKGEHKFEKLSVEQCQKILDTHNIPFKATEPMTLAELFNTDSNVLTSAELKTEKRMGFF